MNHGDEHLDNKSFKYALFIGVLIHFIALFIFIFTVAWKPAIPPPLNPGIEINLGFQDLGKSTIQPKEVTDPDLLNESNTDEPVDNEKEILSELNSNEEKNEVLNNDTENNQNTNIEKAEEKKSDVAAKDILTDEKETIPIKKDDPNKKKKDKTVTPLKTKSKEVIKKIDKKGSDKKKSDPKPKVDKNLFFKKQNRNTKQTKNNNANNNSGDKGDKGQKTESSVYGASLNLSGWEWDSPPQVYDDSSDAGKIVFEIKIDDFGTIMKVVTIERTVTPSVERKYIEAVKKLSFHSVGIAGSDNKHVTGYITFILKSK